ncbi:hypothetical protein, partial [Escherichia coli]|uniref:hypothetical protein n=1 Tax=Escherichia coli TaxID=562 RepID=UPI001BEB2944
NQESRLPPGSDFRRWVWITIAPFVTRTGESHSTGFISPDASLNTAGVFIYKQKGKPIIMEWTPLP